VTCLLEEKGSPTKYRNIREDRNRDGGSIANINADGTFTHDEEVMYAM
jgi:hypothetical protein